MILSNAIKMVNKLGRNKKLTLFPVAIGDDADISILKQFSYNESKCCVKGKIGSNILKDFS